MQVVLDEHIMQLVIKVEHMTQLPKALRAYPSEQVVHVITEFIEVHFRHPVRVS